MAYRVGTIKYRRVSVGWEEGLSRQTFRPVERLDFGNDDGMPESNRICGGAGSDGDVIRSDQAPDGRGDDQ